MKGESQSLLMAHLYASFLPRLHICDSETAFHVPSFIMKLLHSSIFPVVAVIQWVASRHSVAATPSFVRGGHFAKQQSERRLGGCDMIIRGVKGDCIEDEYSLMMAASEAIALPTADSILEFCNEDPIDLSDEI